LTERIENNTGIYAMTSTHTYTKYGKFPFRGNPNEYGRIVMSGKQTTHRASCPLLRRVTLVLLGRTIHREATCAILPNSKNCSHVPTPVAVIRRRPHSRERFIKHVFIAFLHKLVRACDEG
jgi:hypothetical protein